MQLKRNSLVTKGSGGRVELNLSAGFLHSIQSHLVVRLCLNCPCPPVNSAPWCVPAVLCERGPVDSLWEAEQRDGRQGLLLFLFLETHHPVPLQRQGVGVLHTGHSQPVRLTQLKTQTVKHSTMHSVRLKETRGETFCHKSLLLVQTETHLTLSLIKTTPP